MLWFVFSMESTSFMCSGLCVVYEFLYPELDRW